MPTLETTDGKPVAVDPDAVNAQFQASMNDDGPDEQAPPRRQPKPPAEPDAPKQRRARTPRAEQARTSAKPVTVLSDQDRVTGVKGFAQIGAGLALMFGKATKKDAFKADAVTIADQKGKIDGIGADLSNARKDVGIAIGRANFNGIMAVTFGITTAAELAYILAHAFGLVK